MDMKKIGVILILIIINLNFGISQEEKNFENYFDEIANGEIENWNSLSSSQKRNLFSSATSGEKIVFMRKYGEAYNLKLEGFENGLLWGKNSVIGTPDVFVSFDHLPESLSKITYNSETKSFSFEFKDGSSLEIDKGYLSKDKKIHISNENGEKIIEWNGEGSLSVLGKDIVLEKGAKIIKEVNGREIEYSQFYYKNNPEEVYRPENNKDEKGILRLNSRGFYEAKNLKLNVEGIDFYTSRTEFSELKGNVFSESSVSSILGSFVSSDSYIKADIKDDKLSVEYKVVDYGYVDVSDSNLEIEEFNGNPSSGNIYLRNGNTLVLMNEDKVSSNSASRYGNIEIGKIRNLNAEKDDFYLFKEHNGRLLFYNSDEWLSSRATITHGFRGKPKQLDAILSGSKTAGETEYGDFIAKNVGRREMPLKNLYDGLIEGIESKVQEAANKHTNGDVNKLIKGLRSGAGDIATYIGEISRDELTLMKNYHNTIETLNKMRYQYPSVSPYNSFVLSPEKLVINGMVVDTGLNPGVLRVLNKGAVDEGVRGMRLTLREGLRIQRNYKKGVR